MSLRAQLRSFSLVTLPVCLALGCGAGEETPPVDAAPPPAKPVEIARVEAQPFERSLVVPGIVEAETRVELPFRVGGQVAVFHVDEGDRVEAGQTLAELDTADLVRELAMARAALARAQAEARDATLERDRQRKLHEAESTSQRFLEKAESTWQVASAAAREARLRVELAEDRLDKATLRAPFAGFVEERRVEAHEYAAADAPALVLSALDPVKVRAAAADAALAVLERGARARVRSSAWPGREFEGTLVRVGVAADAATRTVPFEVSLPNPELALLPEMAVEVELHRTTGEPVRTVPVAAVLRDSTLEPFCFVVDSANGAAVAERRAVRIGRVHGDRATILAGVEPGEDVVVRGQHLLSAGDAVRIVGD